MKLNLTYLFMFCSVNILSFYLFTKKLMKLSDMVSVLIISLELISKMSGFIGSIDKIMYEISTIQHVQKALDTLNKRHVETNKPVGELKPDLHGDITIRNLDVKLGDVDVLKEINLMIPHGSRVALVGEIGSGKTSLINSMIRLLPYTGTIEIGGCDIQDVDLGHLRTNVLYIPQNPRLFNRSIYDNIAYGSNVTRDEVNETLKRYNINIDIDRNVGKFGQSMSGGQRQIIYLLRALFKDSSIVLLDEPTASLDNETKETIMKILNDLFVGKTVIIISHDKDVLKYVNRVVKLHKGRLV